MGEIYQGRYISGVIAGMKMKEMIDQGVITPEQAKAGYVAAYPYSEVISGYTAFFLGIRSVVPYATMDVKYTDSWSNYKVEKRVAEELIERGCVIISQHSDTLGPAVACEEVYGTRDVYHIGYNQSMIDVAPTSSIISTRINWEPYILGACEAVLANRRIEECIRGNVHGNDIGAGFERDWVQMLELNSIIAAEGSEETMERLIWEFEEGKVNVFYGDYTGVNPYDETDTIDLSTGYKENENTSAPLFGYVLNDVITVVE
jgi:basic membrane protein A